MAWSIDCDSGEELAWSIHCDGGEGVAWSIHCDSGEGVAWSIDCDGGEGVAWLVHCDRGEECAWLMSQGEWLAKKVQTIKFYITHIATNQLGFLIQKAERCGHLKRQ